MTRLRFLDTPMTRVRRQRAVFEMNRAKEDAEVTAALMEAIARAFEPMPLFSSASFRRGREYMRNR